MPSASDTLQERLRQARLVTLAGGPGVGKSWLARDVASREEAVVADARGGIVAGVARALGVAEDEVAVSRSLAGLRKRTVLVVDGADAGGGESSFEAAAILRWLAAAPSLVVLATSRAALGLAGETVVRVAPLSPPDGAQLLARAAAALALPVPSLDIAIRIARAADGLPLALVLAAEKLATLGPVELAERLERDPLATLDAGFRDDSGKPRSLRQAIGVSWDRLAVPTRVVLAALSSFHGSIARDAAVAVAGTGAGDALDALLRAGLLEPLDAGDERRFSVLECVRRFAAEQAPASAAARTSAAAHEAFFLEHAPRWPVARLALERANLCAIHAQALARGSFDLGARIALMLEPWAATTGAFAELVALLDGSLAQEIVDELPNALAADAFRARGQASKALGRADDAARDLAEARRRTDRAQDAALDARVTRAEGLLLLERGDLAGAALHFTRAREIFERVGDERGLARVTVDALYVSQQRGAAVAPESYDGPLTIATRIGARDLEAFVRANRATCLQECGRIDEAIEEHAKARAAFAAAGDVRFEGITLGNRAILLQSAGRFEDADREYAEALACMHAVGARQLEGMVAGYRATLAHERGRPEDAMTLFDAALPLLAAAGARRQLGFFRAARGAAAAALGRLDASRSDFAEAERALPDVGDPSALAAVTLLRGCLDVAEGKRDGAEKRLRVRGPDADDLRLAARLVRAELARWDVDPVNARIAIDGRVIDLSRKPVLVAILERLLRGPASKEDLVIAVWREREYHPLKHDNRLQTAIRKLRVVVEIDPDEPHRVATVADGYLLRDARRATVHDSTRQRRKVAAKRSRR